MEQKRLKIAFLCRDLGKVHRGVETHVLELSQRLKQNHHVEIITGSDAYSFRKMISGNFDLIIPTNGRSQSLKASLGRVLAGYKTIITGHAGIGKDEIWNIAVGAPDVFVALTELEKNWAKKITWKSKVVKIPNGVDLEKFTSLGNKIDINLSQPMILSVGALDWYKYHDRTIRALKYLDHGSLLIIGSGPEKENLNKLIALLGLTERVKILQVNFEDMPMYYRSADLFVLPSWDREAFGIVYLEAMASGLPVVAPNDSSREEIIGKAGILVDVSLGENYALAIKEALNRDWQDLPRKQAEKFSWDKIAKDYESLFREIFNK